MHGLLLVIFLLSLMICGCSQEKFEKVMYTNIFTGKDSRDGKYGFGDGVVRESNAEHIANAALIGGAVGTAAASGGYSQPHYTTYSQQLANEDEIRRVQQETRNAQAEAEEARRNASYATDQLRRARIEEQNRQAEIRRQQNYYDMHAIQQQAQRPYSQKPRLR